MFHFSCPLALLVKPFFKLIDSVDDVTQTFVMECKPTSMFLWIQGRPGLTIVEIRDNVHWQYECDEGFCAYVDLREFMAALESASDEDGIILEGDVILGSLSYYPRMIFTIERRVTGREERRNLPIYGLTIGYKNVVHALRSARTVSCRVRLRSSTFEEFFNRLVAEANESGGNCHVIRVHAGGIIDEHNRALRVRLSQCEVLGVQRHEERYLSINLSVVPTLINASRMSRVSLFFGGPATVQLYIPESILPSTRSLKQLKICRDV
ncbi:hypothetical protein Ancab_018789 [Ancistrocladus abbreviatus]